MKLPFNESTNLLIHRCYRRALWPNYGLHAAYLKMRGRTVDPENADLTIEGFGRSGNTFAVNAMRLSQSKPPRILSHFHYPIAVGRSVAAGVPVCVVLRNPYDSITSYCQYSFWTPQRFIDDFIAYHTYVRPFLDDIVVAEFESFSKDFNCLIEPLNAFYGTNFETVEDHDALSEAAFAEAERQQSTRDGALNELMVGRPSAVRQGRKPEILENIHRNYESRMEEVMALHEVFADRARKLLAQARDAQPEAS